MTLKPGISFNFLSVSTPLILGIISSNNIISYFSPFWIFSKAAKPLSTLSVSIPYESSNLSATFKLILLSSTSNTFLLWVITFSPNSSVSSNLIVGLFTTLWSILIVNLEPLPKTLCTTIFPFISSTNFLVIAKPNPVPSIVTFSSKSSRSNLLNNLSIFSFFIPIPVSSTDIINLQTLFLITPLILNSIHPSLVYLIALVKIFTQICLIRLTSPYKTLGIDGSKLVLNSIGLSPSLPIDKATNSSHIFEKTYSVFTISNLFASILEISKIPLTISSKLSEAITISLTSSLAESGTVSSSSNRLLNPTIAFKGVLISWDILDKKSVLASLAFSAVSLAIFSCSITLTSGFSIVIDIITTTIDKQKLINKIDGKSIWT